jgi:hypothetical protein
MNNKLSKLTIDQRYVSINIDIEKLKDIQKDLSSKISYTWGSKFKSLDEFPPEKTSSDCSNYSRYLIYQASGITIPDGSSNQCDWFNTKGFKKTDYSNCANKDNILRIAFLTDQANGQRHVWLVLNGQTMECYGAHGVGSRMWNANPLRNSVNAYVICA